MLRWLKTVVVSDEEKAPVEASGGPWRRKQPDGRLHGLDVVEALTGPDGWGAETTTGGGRIVWACLDLDAAGE
jgi:hypothetical protein